MKLFVGSFECCAETIPEYGFIKEQEGAAFQFRPPGNGFRLAFSLPGSKESIEPRPSRKLRSSFDAKSNLFAHASGVLPSYPDGHNLALLYCVDIPAGHAPRNSLRPPRKIVTPYDHFCCMCYHYDPAPPLTARSISSNDPPGRDFDDFFLFCFFFPRAGESTFYFSCINFAFSRWPTAKLWRQALNFAPALSRGLDRGSPLSRGSRNCHFIRNKLPFAPQVDALILQSLRTACSLRLHHSAVIVPHFSSYIPPKTPNALRYCLSTEIRGWRHALASRSADSAMAMFGWFAVRLCLSIAQRRRTRYVYLIAKHGLEAQPHGLRKSMNCTYPGTNFCGSSPAPRTVFTTSSFPAFRCENGTGCRATYTTMFVSDTPRALNATTSLFTVTLRTNHRVRAGWVTVMEPTDYGRVAFLDLWREPNPVLRRKNSFAEKLPLVMSLIGRYVSPSLQRLLWAHKFSLLRLHRHRRRCLIRESIPSANAKIVARYLPLRALFQGH